MEMSQKLIQAVKEYKAGNQESFECLYEESKKYIYVCIYRNMSGNPNLQDAIEEIMQETYLEIVLHISQLREDDKFLSWAGTIASQKCKAYVKKYQTEVLVGEDDDTLEQYADSDDIIPEEIMMNQEKRRLVREIIDTKLTTMQKICIYEYYMNDKKQTEIAELYDIPLNTVKTYLSRAKAKIEEAVRELDVKKGTKLFSFGPFFALLFTEDVLAATVPSGITEAVLSAVAAATKATVAKVGLLGKIAAASTKAKVMMAVAAVTVAGATGGTAILAVQSGWFAEAFMENEVETETLEETESTQEIEVIINPSETEEKEIIYIEMEACYQIAQSSDADMSLVDGQRMDWTKWERLGTRIHLEKSVDIYNEIKAKVGYTKENIDAVYVSSDGEWSQLAIGESGYSVYVRTEDLNAAIAQAYYEEGTDVVLISNGAYGEGFSDGENIDMNTLKPASGKRTLTQDINIYSQSKRVIGYMKSGTLLSVVTQSDEWTYVAVTDGNYIVRTEELVSNSTVEETRKEPEQNANDGTGSSTTIPSETPSVPQEDVTNSNINYPAGNYATGSVYGPRLSQRELNEVAEAVNAFLASYDFSAMDEYTKVLTAHDYLCEKVSYAASWAENQANTAWGALCYGEAQCSGYARAMKALCDAMGIGCYYVHADENASNPSHQWNTVCVDGYWYIIDVQCNDSSGWKAMFLVSDDTYVERGGMSWDRSSVPACPDNYHPMGYMPEDLWGY